MSQIMNASNQCGMQPRCCADSNPCCQGGACRRGPAGPVGPMGPVGPVGPPGPSDRVSEIIPYSSGDINFIPCNPADMLAESLVALMVGFGYGTHIDLVHLEAYSFSAIGFIPTRDITIESIYLQVISPTIQVVEDAEMLHASLMRYDPTAKDLLPIGVELSIPLAPGEVGAGEVLQASLAGLSAQVPMNVKLVLAVYLVGESPSCFASITAAGVGFI